MDYRQKVKEYTDELSPRSQQLAVNAIKKLRTQDDRKTWRWIYKALDYKEPEIWEAYGFGLLWKPSYNRQIDYEILHEENLEAIERQASKIDVKSWWDVELSVLDGEE